MTAWYSTNESFIGKFGWGLFNMTFNSSTGDDINYGQVLLMRENV